MTPSKFHPGHFIHQIKIKAVLARSLHPKQEVLELLVWQEPTGHPPASAYGASLGPSARDLGCFLQFFFIKKKKYEDRSCRWVTGIFFQSFVTSTTYFLLEAKPLWCHRAPYPGWVTPVTACAKAGLGFALHRQKRWEPSPLKNTFSSPQNHLFLVPSKVCLSLEKI